MNPERKAIVVGVAGTALDEGERRLFRRLPPAGFILFRRNCENPAQLRRLVAELRGLFDGRPVPIFVDQEGGRVVRLAPPHWPTFPAAATFGRLWAGDPDRAREAVALFATALAALLQTVEMDIDCAPVLDVPDGETSEVIGDRAFAEDAAVVAELGRIFVTAMERCGIAPVIKHIPGHGRARVDSHEQLPIVEVPREALEARDFPPFRRCAHAPFAMTAHVLYTALDPERPATLSPRIISEVIRGTIGFRGILISDDLAMGALSGDPAERAVKALEAGCDLALLCSCEVGIREAALEAVPRISEPTAARLDALMRRLRGLRRPLPLEAIRQQLELRLAGGDA